MPFILVMCDQYHTYFASICSHQSLPTFHCGALSLSLSLSLSLCARARTHTHTHTNGMDLPQIITVVFLQYSHYTSQLL